MSADKDLITGRLNVNDYVEARKADIKNLENLLSNSGANAKKRAFQSLPRTERRRAASHDPSRVPRKRGLRKRAEFEAIRDNSKLNKDRKRKKARLPVNKSVDISQVGSKAEPPSAESPGLRYGHRQRDKVWLPTHIWHKKRAHMIQMAGIIIPKTASQKQFRRTYRLTTHIDERGAMAWDSSYYSTIVVRNIDSSAISSLDHIFPKCSTQIYKTGLKLWQGVCSAGGPSTVYWFNQKELAIQCNPLLFDDLWAALEQIEGAEVEDCRYAIGNIDLIGPQKYNLLTKVLRPVNSSTAFKEAWQLIRESGISPSRMVIECVARDPRLPLHLSPSSVPEKTSFTAGGLYCKEIRQVCIDNQVPQSVINTASDQKEFASANIPVTVMLLDDGRVRLSMPRVWVLPYWLTIFRKRNVLIGGQLELNQLALENKSPCFPYDFPHIPSAAEYLSTAAANLINPKRQRRSSPGVSLPESHNLTDLCHVFVDSKDGGIPAAGSEIIALRREQEGTGNLPCGLITTGNFGFSKARGVGIGLCRKEVFNEKNQESVLINEYSSSTNLISLSAVVKDSSRVL